jgi:FkbM family methyltransferase
VPLILRESVLSAGGGFVYLETADPAIVRHWMRPESYAGTILRQINEDRIYDRVLKDPANTALFGRDDLAILDLGANIGLFSLHVSDIARRVIAVEPTPAHFDILRTLTAGYPNITCLNAAVNSSAEDVTFYLHTTNSTANSMLRYDANSAAIQVRGMTLPAILDAGGLDRVDLCKVDIEGSEEYVITDDALAQARDRVECWYMEVHPTHFGGYEANLASFMSMFRRHGYQATQLSGDGFVASRERVMA